MIGRSKNRAPEKRGQDITEYALILAVMLALTAGAIGLFENNSVSRQIVIA